MLDTTIHGHYKVIKPLGSGAFGRTYLAHNFKASEQSTCVIKQLKLESKDPDVLAKARGWFRREAEALQQLGQHGQIPQLLDAFEEEQEFYLVQEYIEGTVLRELLRQSPSWNEQQALDFLQEVLPILDFIHSKGIIHRDIKPENLIRRVSDQKLFLIDFGAVKQVTQIVQKQSSLTVVHSQGYSPPEQLAGMPEINSDIYALGITCIEALTGISPEALVQLRNPQNRQIMWPESLAISNEFQLILQKMVCTDSHQRYKKAVEVLQNLSQFNTSRTPSIRNHYTPTEITTINSVDFQQSWQPSYTPTEVSTLDLDEPISIGKQEGEKVNHLSSSPSTDLAHNSQYLFNQLNQQLQNLEVPVIRNKLSTIQLFIKRKPALLVSSLLIIMITSVALYALAQNNSNQSIQPARLSDRKPIKENKTILEEKYHFPNESAPIAFLDFSSNGSTVIAASEDGSVKIHNLQKQTSKLLTQTSSKLLALVLSDNHKHLALTTQDRIIEVWDLVHFKKNHQITVEQLVWSLALNSKGQMLAAGSLGHIQVWSLQQRPRLLRTHSIDSGKPEPIQTLSFSLDSDTLFGGSADGSVYLLNTKSNSIQKFQKHTKAIRTIAIDYSSQSLFTGSVDDTVNIWHLKKETKQPASIITANMGGVQAIAKNPHSSMIAAGGAYGVIRLWNWQTTQPIASLTLASEITALAFSPDGKMLAVGNQSGETVIYQLK